MDWKNLLHRATRPASVESTAGSMPADKKQALNEALGDAVYSLERFSHGYHDPKLLTLYIALRDMCEGDMPNLRDTQKAFMRAGHTRSAAMERAQHALPERLETLAQAHAIAEACYREMSWRLTGSSHGSQASVDRAARLIGSIEKAQPLITELITLAQSQQAGQGPGTKPA